MSKPDDPWIYMKMMLEKLIANEELAKQRGDPQLSVATAGQLRRKSMSTFMKPTGKITILHFNDVSFWRSCELCFVAVGIVSSILHAYACIPSGV